MLDYDIQQPIMYCNFAQRVRCSYITTYDTSCLKNFLSSNRTGGVELMDGME